MPYCHGCHQEFREGFDRCADCDLPLHDAPPESGGEGALQTLFLATETPELAVEIAGLCREKELPCLPVGDPPEGLLLPLEVAETVVQALLKAREDLVLEPGDGEAPPRLRTATEAERLQRLEEDEIEECDLLDLSPEELAGNGPALDHLVKVAVRGTPELSARAVRMLARLGEGGHLRLQGLVAELCRGGEDLLLRLVLPVVQEYDVPGMDRVLGGLLEEERPEVVLLALHGIWSLRLEGLARPVCALLLHPEPRVQEEADEVLTALTGRDLGFAATLPEAERRRLMNERLAGLGG